MDERQVLDGGKVVLLVIPNARYSEISSQATLAMSGKKICYVTLNKTHSALQESLSKEGMDVQKVVFVDAISKMIRNAPEQTDGCYFASSPSALTEISILVSKCLKHGFDCVIFDSLSNLLIYQDKVPVTRFVSNIANQARASNACAVFFSTDIEAQQHVLKECAMMVDKVVKL
jgi:KaiC/GvpD/RAD55 family RecA-like ATPase